MKHDNNDDDEVLEASLRGVIHGGLVVKLSEELRIPVHVADLVLSDVGWDYDIAKEAVEKRISRPIRPHQQWYYDRSIKLSFER